MSDHTDTARQYAGDAREMYEVQSPGPAILIAVAAGFILGRFAR